MNKKHVCVSFLLMTFLAIGFSCSVLSPDTSSGSDIVKSVDSTVTNLKGGFAKLDSVFLTVSGARSLVVPGGDTTAYVLHSGEHVNQIVAGRIGNDSVVTYEEFHLSSGNLTTLRTGCSNPANRQDSVYLLLHYATSINDTSYKSFPADTMVHVQVYSCQRKFLPRVQNGLLTPDIAFSDSVTFSRKRTDTTFYLRLGPDVVNAMLAAELDTTYYKPHVAETDTLIGRVAGDTGKRTKADTIWVPDTGRISFADTLQGVRSVTGFSGKRSGDTVFVNYVASTVSKADTAFLADTTALLQTIVGSVSFVDSVLVASHDTIVDSVSITTHDTVADTVSIRDTLHDTLHTIVQYSALQLRTLRQRLVYDSVDKYVAALHIYATAGRGVVRFLGPPVFYIRYRDSNCDTAASTKGSVTSSALNYYFDMTVKETDSSSLSASANDSLVASWQADRFAEIPIDLTPIWKFATGGGNGTAYRIVQNATFFLNASLPSVELQGNDTNHRKQRDIVYGLLDHPITGARAQSVAAYDSLLAFVASGRLANDSVFQTPTQIQLPVTIFMQSLYEESPRPSTAYLYVFERVPSNFPFGRVAIAKPKTVKCAALFTNPQQ
jgi:hypothetical protein